MEIKRIVLIGAGNLGSRHLQALALISEDVCIEVVDPSAEALHISKERFAEMPVNPHIKSVQYYTEIDHLGAEIAVAIVATSANVRKNIVEHLIHHKKVQYFVLEKVVFQAYEDFIYIHNLLAQKKIKAWVNCPRRMFRFYQKLRENLREASFVDLSVKGAQWGLGCNSVHMLDLYAFLAGSHSFRLDIAELNPGWIDSKRKGFSEFTGTLLGIGAKGKVRLTSYSQGNMPCVVDIASEKIRCIIDEGRQIARIARQEENWEWDALEFDLKYQSRLTHVVVEDLLQKGTCELTEYEESMIIHKELLNSFLQHMNKTSAEEFKKCPIT